MIDSHRRNLANLETTVELLNARAEFSTLGFNLKGFVSSFDNLPSTPEENDTYGVGTTTPYTFYVYSNNNWVSLGLFPLPGPKGNPGDKGEDGKIGPVGPKGQKGDQGAVGPAGSGLGVNYVTDLVLSKGSSTSVSYNQSTGAALSKQGQIIAAGNTYDITVTDKLPIIPGDNINIYTNGANNAIKIGAKVPVSSVNGQKGDVILSIPTDTSDLTNNAHFVTEDYHDPSKQDTLVSGQNIKTINNQSILGQGNITISGGSSGVSSVNGHTGAINIVGGTNVSINDSNGTLTINASGGGGSGTDTGFDNVREIQAADSQTTYNPDTKEYIISSGTADIFYKDGTKTSIPYVQEIGLMAGDNITFTEEFVDNANYRVKINATGGGSASDGFNNLKELILTPSTYVNNTPAGDFYFEGNGTFKLKDSSSATGIESIKVQLPVVPGDGIIFDKTTDGNCKIKAADYKPTITLETSSATQSTSHYGRIYYKFDVGNSNTATDIANGKYNVTIYDQTSGGGYYYCPLQGDTMTFLGEEVPNDNNGGKPSSIVGWSFKAKESGTVVGFWRDSLSLSGGGGGGGSSSIYQHTITMQGSQYKYKFTVVNSYQGSITGSSIWKEIYGTNKFTVPAIVTDSTDHTVSISSVYVGITPMNSLSILFFPTGGSGQYSETISSSSTWEDNIISL